MNLYFMVGVPGAGKGFYIENNLSHSVVCSADHFFYELGNGTYAFDPKRLGEAHAACQRKAREAMQAGQYDVVIDNTNLASWQFEPYLELASSFGYTPAIIRITPRDFDEAFRRNIHGLPKAAHDKMSEQFSKRDYPGCIPVTEVYV